MAVKMKQGGKYMEKLYNVCVDPTYVRNAEILNTDMLTDDEIVDFEWLSADADHLWVEFEAKMYAGTVAAEGETEACKLVGKLRDCDPRILYAFEVQAFNKPSEP